MNLKRTTTLVVVGAALVAWLAGAATSNHAIPKVPVVERTTIETRGGELAREIERLHERLAPVAAPRTPGRNLFAFRATAPRPMPASPAARPAISEAAPAAFALAPLRLSGIAEDAGADGPIRIAFISGDGQLYMVKEGDAVTPRYKVAKISADVVELVDVADNSTRRLALR